MNRTIYLIGFMGSGKTSVGKKLANKLDREFYDLDAFIESKEGKTITEIFAEIGEKGFRDLESNYLRELAKKQNAVVALGGGTPCVSNNLEIIKASGISVYLKQEASFLIGRLRLKKAKRPLIADLNDYEISSFVNQKLKERSHFYEQADFILESNHPNAKLILKKLEIT